MKKIISKLVKQCTENVEEARLVEKTLSEIEHKCSSCTVHKVLF